MNKWFEIENLWKFIKKGDYEIPLLGFFNFPATENCKTRVRGFYLLGFSFEWCRE